ncbi:unnamed protein product [Diabrotica balteata]|uniref:DNA mismatch repair proteins mutS family domain-containing protein n=1 Tax=Diabrotica balteata TaxID=107213 RepID=A0A9N9T160_DIABA|nr:unnamed protein product [Diabrotica balteata]
MAKRQSTLFNYFSSPKVPKKEVTKKEIAKSDDEEEIITTKKRHRQVLDDSSDSDNEGNKKKTSKRDVRSSSSSESENSSPNKSKKVSVKNKKNKEDSDEESVSPKKPVKAVFTKPVSSESSSQESSTNNEATDMHTSWLHNTLDFLKPENIRDINKRKPDHPEYDSRTLYVPEKYLATLTPVMKQWWELKSRHMDTVLFFKVGKFYELYHMDAVVGVIELGFSYMKGEFAHSGFPESAYGKMLPILLEQGYKVARVEQTETPEMMAERCRGKSTTKFDKVVKRELCQITSDAVCVYTAQMEDWQNEKPRFMIAICTKDGAYGTARIGVCLVETSMGFFHLSEFDDDKHFSRLLALFTEFPPVLILTEKGTVSKELSELLQTHFKDIKQDSLVTKSQFYTAYDTLEKLSSACYFRDSEGNFAWPEFFKTVADDCMPKPEYELVIRSLGACMWYLKDCKVDIQVLSMKKFKWYDPLDFTLKDKRNQDHLVLDSATIHNLELLGFSNTLKSVLDHCKTSFGKRLLARWICRPLCDPVKIKERQNAIKHLVNDTSLLQDVQNILKETPDLERLLMKIHTYGSKSLTTQHPDGKAILYDNKTYSKNKIRDFLKTLKGFEKACEITHLFKGCEDRLLRKLTQVKPTGGFEDLSETLRYFENAFDQQEAEKEGKIIPRKGVVEEFDEVEDTIDSINKKLNDYLKEQSKFFGCSVKYVGTDRKRFQLEVPDNKSHKATEKYRLEGSKKGASKKFTTDTTRELLAEMIEAEGIRAKVILDISRKIFEKFSSKQDQFDRVIQCLTVLDVICSLAEYAKNYSYDICLPNVLPFSDEPKLIIQDGRHPCAQNLDSFVPNDTMMGVDGFPSLIVITGPNMGGKSTLMRQIAVICVMAQMGSYVPASKCELTLLDRIFTRLGAQDDLTKAQSTFYVELSEASCILQYATKHSLVIIDELGRGTSTHDGNAIATSYVKKLTEFKCRTTFSTHYHSLVDHFTDSPEVQLGHMACMIENEDNEEEISVEHVTFLYKMAKGRCPKSYGFNAARLAGLDNKLISEGMAVARRFEDRNKLWNAFQTSIHSKQISDIRRAITSLSV